jgi:hypothetical protein
VKRRAATAEQIAAWVAQVGCEKDEIAVQMLREVGPPASSVLEAAERKADEDRKTRLRHLRDQIDLADALTPRRIHLRFDKTPLRDATRALEKVGDISIFSGSLDRTVTLDIDGLSFFQAIDRLCEKTGLSASFYGTVVYLAEGKPPKPEAGADAGPLRIRATHATRTHTLSLDGQPRPGFEDRVRLDLSLVAEPVANRLFLRTFRFTAAEDTDGRSLVLGNEPIRSIGPSGRSAFLELHLRPPARPGGKLKRLEGVVGVEAVVRRHDRLSLPDLEKAVGKLFPIAGGGWLNVTRFQALGDQYHLNVTIQTVGRWRFDPSRYGFELLDDQGRRIQPEFVSGFPGTRSRFYPEDLLLLAPLPSQPPWAGLFFQTQLRRPNSLAAGMLQFRTIRSPGAKYKLIFYEHDRLRTDLQFEFRDLPLP